ncbi:MAG: OmpA family protein [Acidobacteria bacterium]|nr:OmpA family protein [Acidobacteriota bacterium]
MNKRMTNFSAAAALLALVGIVGVTGGCASKKYVRTTVDTTTSESAARLDARIDETEGKTEANSQQIQELGGVTRQQTDKIASLDSNVQQVDSKTQQALTVGQQAQRAAEKVSGDVSTLDMKFQNRNNYQTLSEEKILFTFNSTKLADNYKQILDGLAEQIRSNPDTIIVMEGRTDGTGDDQYNVQLGEKRAESVIRYLVVEKEVPMHRIYKMSFGEAKPLAPNNTRDGRAENRSVLIRLMGSSSNASAAAGQRTVSETSSQQSGTEEEGLSPRTEEEGLNPTTEEEGVYSPQ